MANKVDQTFIDTSFFKGIIDEKDDFNGQSIVIWQKIKETKTTLITTNYVLDETFTLIRKRRGLVKAKELRDFLVQVASQLKIVRVLSADDAKAWEWFEKDWSDLSFTDCVSFAVMKRSGLEKVLSFDSHFSRAGFEIVK